jgi:hypothetical protein
MEMPASPILPPASHVHVEGPARRETVWNPLEGDPLRMAALSASGMEAGPPAAPAAPASGNGAAGRRPAKAPPREPSPPPAAREDVPSPPPPTSSTPPGARLRPVTGRRQRDPLPATISITAGSYRSNLAPPPPPGAVSTSAMMPPMSPVPGSAPPPGWQRGARLLAGLLIAGLLCAGAAFGIARALPPVSLLKSSIAFERDASPIDAHALREFHDAQEMLLWSRPTRDAAARLLAQRQPDVDPGFLANIHLLTRSAQLRWETSADVTRDELVLEYATTDPSADAERLTKLFLALHDASTRQGASDRADALKVQLLETEANDYARELEYLRRRLQTLQEELRIARLGVPGEGEIEALKSDVALLSAAYQTALADRIRADVEATGAAPPAPPPSTGPAALPDAGPPGIEQFHRLERDALAALRAAEKHLADALAQQEAIERKEREVNGVNDTIDSLSRTLDAKQKELAAAAGERRPLFRPLPPSPAQVIRVRDDRPFWIGLSIAAVSLAFAGYVALNSRGRGQG